MVSQKPDADGREGGGKRGETVGLSQKREKGNTIPLTSGNGQAGLKTVSESGKKKKRKKAKNHCQRGRKKLFGWGGAMGENLIFTSNAAKNIVQRLPGGAFGEEGERELLSGKKIA